MRLVTRADFDGLVSGALITMIEEIDSYLFVEPKFMQDGMVEIVPGDVIANLPYHPNCTLWFDHHITNAGSWLYHIGASTSQSEKPRSESEYPTVVPEKGGFRLAPSAARVVYEYYIALEGEKQAQQRGAASPTLNTLNSKRIKYLLEETDRIDAGHLAPQDVLHPAGYVLISMTLEGKNSEDEPYWKKLIALLREATLSETLADREVKRRCRQILDDQERLKTILLNCSSLKGNVIFVDLRGVKDIPEGNRFLLYTLFPCGNISLKIAHDSQRANTTAISVGYNIFNPTSNVNVGALLERFGGGGHRVVGSCRVPDEQAEKAIEEIFSAVKE